jgi:hypothetical protein
MANVFLEGEREERQRQWLIEVALLHAKKVSVVLRVVIVMRLPRVEFLFDGTLRIF